MRPSKRLLKRQLFSIPVLLILTLTLTGCWSSHEINNLAVINVMGIDENAEGSVVLTADIIKPNALFSETAWERTGNYQQSNSIVTSTTGRSIYEAMSQLSSSLSGRIYLGHLDAIIFGEKAATDRMMPSLDFFKRENNFRPNIYMLVTKGTAQELMNVKPQLNTTLGLEIQQLITANRFSATGMVRDISQFIKNMSSPDKDAYTGVIGSTQPKDAAIETDATSTNNQQKTPRLLNLTETAVFNGGNLAGYLDATQTRGLLWLKGRLSEEVVVLDCGGTDKETISLKITHTRSYLSPRIVGGAPAMTVHIGVNADLGEVGCTDFKYDTAQINGLNKQLAKVVKQELSSAINIAGKQWQTDIFDFGQAFYRRYPKQWAKMAPQWRNGLLRSLPIKLDVDANITRNGLLKDTLKSSETR